MLICGIRFDGIKLMELISWGLFDETKNWFDEKVDPVRNKDEGNVADLVSNQNKD
jgi:hypothetical protein